MALHATLDVFHAIMHTLTERWIHLFHSQISYNDADSDRSWGGREKEEQAQERGEGRERERIHVSS